MKTAKKLIFAVMCVAVAAACIVASVPKARAAGVLRMVIDDHTYSKEYTDLGALALTNWHYSASKDVLTLENYGTSYAPRPEIFIYPYSGNVTVNLKGDNYIYSSMDNAMIFIGNVTFVGDGSLTLITDNTYAINTDYKVTVAESATLNINGLAGIMAINGIEINTTGNVNIHTTTRCMYTFGDLNIINGRVRMSGSDGLYSSKGNVFISGGPTDVEVRARTKAFALYGEDSRVEWSANASVGGGSSSPGSIITEYNGEKYFRITFNGNPKLNPPRKIWWDDTVIDSSGTTNPVARWSEVEHATGYVVNLYYYVENLGGYELKNTFTVTDSLSFNFAGHFTTYGKYYFSVQALGDGEEYISSNESQKSDNFYRFSGDVASRFYVRLPESDYYKIIPDSGSPFVYYGEDFLFTIEVDPAYDQSELLVWANKARVSIINGKYTIRNVTENITITVGALALNTYTVNLPTSEAYTIYPLPEYSTEVEYGGKFAFSIELSDYYMQSNPVVTSNGEVIKPKYGIIYTISNITEDQYVEITGLVRDSYDVTFMNIDGTVISSQTVDHGYTATVPEPPEAPEGMTFTNWTDESGAVFDFSTPIVEQTNIYARFETAKSEDGYYLISNLEQLIWFRNEVNFGNTAINGRLTADIEMNDGKYVMIGSTASFYDSATMWVPIGGYDYSDKEDYMKFYGGDFDGDSHTLSGFYIKHDPMAANASELGIFGIITEEASVSNLNVIRSYFEGYGKIGSIVGDSDGLISGCSSTAAIVGISGCGGIVGELSGDISDSTFGGSVTVKQYQAPTSTSAIGGGNAGGIAGLLLGDSISISGCANSGTVKAYDRSGGIVGYCNAASLTVDGCSNTASVTAVNAAGGIVARSTNAVVMNNSFNTGAVNGGTYIGGLIGKGDVSGTLNYNTGAVSGGTYSGGIVGSGSIDMSYFYNAGNIVATSVGGGIAGEAPTFKVKQGHSFATVSANNAAVLCAVYDTADVTSFYYCMQYGDSAFGTSVNYSWFYCGYASGLLNRENGADFWAHNGYYPIFADEDNPAFEFELKYSDVGECLIENERDLHLVSAFVNNEDGYSSLYYLITADIIFHAPELENNFIPIGTVDSPFDGTLAGDGHFISGINVNGGENVALFGVADNTNMESVTVKDSIFIGTDNVGAVIGKCLRAGYFYNCDSQNCVVSGNSSVGGVVGYLVGNTIFCDNIGTDVNGGEAYGGIAGTSDTGAIDFCYSSGNVTASKSGAVEAGGIVGRNFGDITYSANIGNVSGVTYVGGVAGACYGNMLSVYNAGAITGTDGFGSICGTFDESFEAERCFYLENTAGEGQLVMGEAQTEYQIVNGTTAYFLNDNGEDPMWAQGEKHPVFAKEDFSDAVVYKVVFEVFDEFYWMAATKKGGTIITPPVPEAEGYTFVGWDTTFHYVVADCYVRAVFDMPDMITFISTSFLKLNDHPDGAYIYGIYPNMNMTVSQLNAQISNANVMYLDQDCVLELEPNDKLFTGATVILEGEMGEWLHTAYIVIYGDVTGDGNVDQNDAFFINLLADGMLEEYDFTYPQYLAADVNHDGTVNRADSLLIQNTCMKNDYINQLPS